MMCKDKKLVTALQKIKNVVPLREEKMQENIYFQTAFLYTSNKINNSGFLDSVSNASLSDTQKLLPMVTGPFLSFLKPSQLPGEYYVYGLYC